ncbi:MAG: hypothetical protein JOZ77_08135 [Candidatus Eremiobacteraeota bacterium]|nr:hypothetical protein [Candidatus Eremiobacteraeota bacterium]
MTNNASETIILGFSEPTTLPVFEQATFANFVTEYFRQSKAEIDSAKSERNIALNITVLVVTAFVWLFAQSFAKPSWPWLVSSDDQPVPRGMFIAVAVAALLTIYALFRLRRDKLQQIANRWYVLRKLLTNMGARDDQSSTMEFIVCSFFDRDSQRSRDTWPILRPLECLRHHYAGDDAMLHLCIAVPLCAFIFYLVWQGSPICALPVGVTAAIYLLRICWLLGRPLADPTKSNGHTQFPSALPMAVSAPDADLITRKENPAGSM